MAKRALIVDDEKLIVKGIRFSLEQDGMEVDCAYDGDEALAVDLWRQVLLLDENNELANTGIGKAYLTAGDYESAMKYLKLGMSRDYYSVAYKRYRNAYLTEHASVFLTLLILVVIAIYVVNILKKRGIIKTKKKRKRLTSDVYGMFEEDGPDIAVEVIGEKERS